MVSVSDILKELNKDLPPGSEEWVPVEGLHAMSATTLGYPGLLGNFGLSSVYSPYSSYATSKNRSLSTDTSKGMVVKAFFNNRTAEIRTFLSQEISDLPETDGIGIYDPRL